MDPKIPNLTIFIQTAQAENKKPNLKVEKSYSPQSQIKQQLQKR